MTDTPPLATADRPSDGHSHRSPMLGVAAATVACAGVLVGVEAWKRRREHQRQQQPLRHAAEAAGSGLSRLGVWASQPFARRPDLAAELGSAVLLEAAYMLSNARERRRQAEARVRRRG